MLQAKELTKHYQSHVALDGLNLTVNPGEILCLLGQNGAGKTTTINLFLGFISPTAGQALVNGKIVDPSNKSSRKHLAYIPEVVMLYGELSAIENLSYFSRLAGFSYDKPTLSSYLDRCGLAREAHYKKLSGFSKGMRQKVGIAIALAKNADAILMDEPTSGLDPKATDEFSALVRQLGQAGKSILMTTHDIFNAVNVGTHIGIMRRGKLVHTLSAANISASDLQKLYLETI